MSKTFAFSMSFGQRVSWFHSLNDLQAFYAFYIVEWKSAKYYQVCWINPIDNIRRDPASMAFLMVS